MRISLMYRDPGCKFLLALTHYLLQICTWCSFMSTHAKGCCIFHHEKTVSVRLASLVVGQIFCVKPALFAYLLTAPPRVRLSFSTLFRATTPSYSAVFPMSSISNDFPSIFHLTQRQRTRHICFSPFPRSIKYECQHNFADSRVPRSGRVEPCSHQWLQFFFLEVRSLSKYILRCPSNSTVFTFTCHVLFILYMGGAI